MQKHYKVLLASGIAMLSVSAACSTAYAAKPLDLKNQPLSVLQSFTAPGFAATSKEAIQQQSASIDFNQTTHIRIKQTYAGYPVWGAEGIVHVPKGNKASLMGLISNNNAKANMNGTVYQGLAQDLQSAPESVKSPEQAQKILKQAVDLYQTKSGTKFTTKDSKTQLMVYIDKQNKAHWAYLVSFLAETTQNALPALPTYIIDAVTFNVYKEWNNIQTASSAFGGGYGGNDKMGKLVYDGLPNDLGKLDIMRAPIFKLCMLQNNNVTVKDARKLYMTMSYPCSSTNSEHNNVYWSGEADAVNGAYSPGNDALFQGKIIQDMYQQWYNIPALKDKSGKPLMLTMNVHISGLQNAYFQPSNQQMYFGDGGDILYPLVSLGVGAHEISHGFTAQHSNLVYEGQSGGLNESYSDMAAQAAEYFAYGHSTWQIGAEIFKAPDQALRYMDEPTKDCRAGQAPGDGCSIDNAKDYSDGINVHYTSGVFNKAFYLLATADGWNTRKAFDVMVQANQNYWTSTTSFESAACGVLSAAQDYKYDVETVERVMAQVGISTLSCSATPFPAPPRN